RFLRAYYVYACFDLFGKVPFREYDETDYSIPSKVMTSEEATTWVIDELTTIIPLMKSKSDIPYGRVSKGAAQTLLAKIYLNSEVYTGTARWNDVIAACNEVIGSGEYSIATDYWAMFQYPKSTEDEEIFVIIHNDEYDEGGGGVWVNFTLHYNQVFGTYTSLWNGGCITATFFDKWDQNDVRFYDDRNVDALGFNQGFLVGQQYGPAPDYTALEDRNGNPLIFTKDVNLRSASETEGIRCIKFAPNPETTRQFNEGNDFPVFRISDVYLMRAEAKLRNNDESGALPDVNAVRSKRGVADLTSLTLDNLLDERGFELYWEGHRRQDLIRFGKFTAAYSEKPVTEASKQLFPIPQSALDVNPNLIQNSGY
ncbi:MAG: RagB/SusD family nutrient uptake outer membrane protein, partial [Bacteroidales bacterium]|nr:RagB/SusD family nutrient uptake outer membrane protein [Bacteroidales bacterium]